MDVLDELMDKSYELGVKLMVPASKVESIHKTYKKPRSRLLQVLVEFLNQETPPPTWTAIVDALRSRTVNLFELAGRVEAAHFPESTLSSNVILHA